MKQILVIGLVLLSGCANLVFDSRQYDSFISLKEEIDIAKHHCNSSEQMKVHFDKIYVRLNHELLYASYRDNMKQTASSIRSLMEITNGAKQYYNHSTPSTSYCEIKINLLSAGLMPIITTLGGM